MKGVFKRKIKKMRRQHKAEIVEATAYLLAHIDQLESETLMSRQEAARAGAAEDALRDELMEMTIKMAATQGVLSALTAAARGEPHLVHVPTLEDIVPANHKWWH